MEQQGIIKSIGELKQVSDNFKLKEVIMVTEDKYPQTLSFQFSNKNIDTLNGIGEGQKATIHFNLRGREYNGRVFNSLDAWKVSGVSVAQTETKSDNTFIPKKDEDLGF